jgi:Ala-tRNA(Pro) deacylase
MFLDRQLQRAERVSFHPCINTAPLMVTRADFERFLQYMGNPYEWIDLY